MADIAKRLAFEDLTLTLSRANAGGVSDLKAKLLELVSSCEQQNKTLDDRTNAAKDQVLKQLQVTGGKQLLKRQLQSLKSSLQNLGQKECFSEAILSFSDLHDFKSEADRIAAALESAEEDLKDLKKANHQDEEHLQEAIRMIDQYQEQHQQVMARLNQKLDASAKDFAALGANRPPALSPLPSSINEDELEGLIAEQNQLAMTLEGDLAKAEACCQDLEGDLQSHLTEMCRMEAEITRLKAHQHDEAKLVEDRHAAAVSWCDMMMGIAAQLTGVSLVSIKEDVICLRIQQGMHKGTNLFEHTLTAHLQPGTSLLESATLAPPTVDLAPLVAVAKDTGGSLALLLNMVRGLLHDKAQSSGQISPTWS